MDGLLCLGKQRVSGEGKRAERHVHNKRSESESESESKAKGDSISCNELMRWIMVCYQGQAGHLGRIPCMESMDVVKWGKRVKDAAGSYGAREDATQTWTRQTTQKPG